MSKSSSKLPLGLGAVLVLIGLVLLLLGLFTGGGAKLSQMSNGSQVGASGSGFSIYAQDKALRENAICRAGDQVLQRPSADSEVKADGNSYWEIARAGDAQNSGDFLVRCESVNDATLFAGPRADKIGGGLLKTLGLILGPILLVAGLALVLFSLLRGKKSAAPAAAPSGGYQQSGYGQ